MPRPRERKELLPSAREAQDSFSMLERLNTGRLKKRGREKV